MSNDKILRMHYNPFDKSVVFTAFNKNKGDYTEITSSYATYTYMKKNGEFLLQNCGDNFLRDIAKFFDGYDSGVIEVTTAKEDFKDLQKMVELYNENKENRRLEVKLVKKLPSTKEYTNSALLYGKKAIDILTSCKDDCEKILESTDKEKENAIASITSFCSQLSEHIKEVEAAIGAAKANPVNILFAGVYSSGKSTIINGLIGEDILPTDSDPTTATCFIIRSPKKGTKPYVRCKINEVDSFFRWDGESFKIQGKFKGNIKEIIAQSVDNTMSDKFHTLLEYLNKEEDVDTIYVYYPLAIDKENLHFTIYDTPGTDSGNKSHADKLVRSLAMQTNTIVAYVFTATGQQNTGTSLLLSYLSDTVDSKIDLTRSLYLHNKSESEDVTKVVSRPLGHKDDSVSIDLKDKKVLFITARGSADIRKAALAGEATEKSEEILDDNYSKITEKRGRYFRYNLHCNDDAENEREKAREEGKKAYEYHICSGMYSLEKELLNYALRFAPTVKAVAVENSVSAAVLTVKSKASSLTFDSEKGVESIAEDLKHILEKLIKELDDLKKKHKFRGIYFRNKEEIIKKARKYYLEEKHVSLDPIHSSWNKEQIERMTNHINCTLSRHFNDIIDREIRKAESNIWGDIEEIINNDEYLKDDMKEKLLGRRSPKISFNVHFETTYKSNTIDLWILKIIKRTNFKEQVEKELKEKIDDLFKKTEDLLTTTIDDMISGCVNSLKKDIAEFSLDIKAKYEDKEIMEKIHKAVLKAESALSELADEKARE
jgi:hypothetical protein